MANKVCQTCLWHVEYWDEVEQEDGTVKVYDDGCICENNYSNNHMDSCLSLGQVKDCIQWEGGN